VQTHDEAEGVHDDARSIGLFVGPRTLGGINYLLSLRSRDIYRYLRDSEVIAWLRSLSLASRSGSRFQMLPTHRSIQIQMTIEHKAGAWCIAASSVDFGNGLTRLVPPTSRLYIRTSSRQLCETHSVASPPPSGTPRNRHGY